MNLPQDLIAGDILLYATKDLVDDVIEWKTSADVAHVELYVGDGKSWASRNGIGVNAYDFRSQGLMRVRRPKVAFNLAKAQPWFDSKEKGQPYGFGDILENAGVDVVMNGEDCSHFVKDAMEQGDAPQFDPSFSGPKTTPRDFETSFQSVQIYP
jgi:cell wall-associated NlpC family hydrolase